MNWVLGHIVENRNNILEVVGLKNIWNAEKRSLYKRGSKPILPDSNCLDFEELLGDLEISLETLLPYLRSMPDEFFNLENKPENVRNTKLDKLTFYLWHETYHIGQLELLRQLAGKNDSIIP